MVIFILIQQLGEMEKFRQMFNQLENAEVAMLRGV